MKVEKTILFVSHGTFYYGQGETLVDCFADAKAGFENFEEDYKMGFDMADAMNPKKVVDTEKYCVCFDDALDYGQRAFIGTGARVKSKALELCCAGRVDAMWVFPMNKKISVMKLVKDIRKNPKGYKKVADWLGEEKW